jgi:hypothetical protein
LNALDSASTVAGALLMLAHPVVSTIAMIAETLVTLVKNDMWPPVMPGLKDGICP